VHRTARSVDGPGGEPKKDSGIGEGGPPALEGVVVAVVVVGVVTGVEDDELESANMVGDNVLSGGLYNLDSVRMVRSE
jgi:hypothetical protein